MAEKKVNEKENELKLIFFEVLLEKREDIKRQYQEFMLSKRKNKSIVKQVKDIEQLIEEVNELTKEYIDELEVIDLENFDWEDYVPRHSGYIPEYEALAHMAEDLVGEVMSSWESILLGYLNSGDSSSAIIHLIAQYNACLLAEIDDPCENLGDPSDFIKDELKSIFEKIIPTFKKLILSDNQVKTVVQLFFHEADILKESLSHFLHFFEPLFLVIIDTKIKAESFCALLKSYNISKESLPQIVLQANKLLDDEQSWVENAEALYTFDKEVAKQLMDYYSNNKNLTAFLRVSKKVFSVFKSTFVDYILEKINEKSDLEFYKELLMYKVKNQCHFLSFKKLRPLLRSDDIDSIIDSFHCSLEIKIQILEYEKRYDDIYKIVVDNKSFIYDFPMLIKPILNVFPNECFSIIQKKCIETLQKERGRYIYQCIVGWLQLSKTIVGYEKKVDLLIMQLYNWQPRLPALRDELKRGGLV